MTARRRWMLAAMIAATLLAYLPALSAPYVMDDETAIAESASAQYAVPAGSPIAGRPVVRATLAANFALNALLGIDQRPDPDGPHKAIGYRLVNLLFHLCTGALLFGLVRRAMREKHVARSWRDSAEPIAAVVAALWLLHPIQTEAINYIVQRTEILASLFYAATLYASLRAWDAPTGAARLRWYAAALLACVLGMASKEIVITAPLSVILYDRAFRLDSWGAVARPGRGRGWYYLALAGSALATFALVAAGARGNTAGLGGPMTWYGYLYSQGWAIAHYLRLVVWPAALNVDYGERLVTGARGVPGAIVVALLAIGTLVSWARLPKLGWLAFLGAEFFVLLAPSSSIVPIRTEIAAERRMYLALACVLVLAVVGAEWARRRWFAAAAPRRTALAAGAAALALCGATAVRSHTYSSSELLWRDAVARMPENPRAKANLGYALTRARPPKLAEAESVLRMAIVQDTSCRNGCAQLASVLGAEGRHGEAVQILDRALASDPGNVQVEGRLALNLMETGDFEHAIAHLEHMATVRPNPHVLMILGVADLASQRQQHAMEAFQAAAQLNPGNPEVQRLGNSLFSAGRTEAALPFLRKLAIDLSMEMQ